MFRYNLIHTIQALKLYYIVIPDHTADNFHRFHLQSCRSDFYVDVGLNGGGLCSQPNQFGKLWGSISAFRVYHPRSYIEVRFWTNEVRNSKNNNIQIMKFALVSVNYKHYHSSIKVSLKQ